MGQEARHEEREPPHHRETFRRTTSRGDENAVVRWLLVDGSRPGLAVVISVAVFVGFFALGRAGVLGVTNASLVAGAFTAAITGVFTLVSITVSVNQVVLSRILGSPGEIGHRRESVEAFRADVADLDPDVSVTPTQPASVLAVVVAGTRIRARRLGEVYGDHHDAALRADVDELVSTLEATADHVDGRLAGDRSDLLYILSLVLDDRYSKHRYTVQRIEADSRELSDAERVALDRLAEALDLVNLTRHYFKTLYIHEELTDLSRLLLASGLPSLLACVAVILFYDGAASAVGSATLLLVVSAAVAVAIVPLTLLAVYGLRLATIGKRTTAFGTLTPPAELP